MSMEPITGEQMMNAIDAMRRSLETQEQFDPDDDLLIASKFNVRRKARMINAMRRYFAYRHGNGPKPEMMPSQAFDPTLGPEKTNIYYFFKELKKRLPWELNHNILIEPIAYTLVMLDIANRLFPCPTVTKGMISFKDLVNLLTIRRFNPEETEEENRRKREGYFKRIDALETDIRQFYVDMSNYFTELEDPDKNPKAKTLHNIDTRTAKMAAKMKVDERNGALSATAQKIAYNLWNDHNHDLGLGIKGRKNGYSDLFDKYRSQLEKHGIKTVSDFRRAVKNHQRMCQRKVRGK